MQNLKEIIIQLKELIKDCWPNFEVKDFLDDVKHIKRDFAKKYSLKDIPSNIQLIKEYQKMIQSWEIKKDINLEKILRKRAIRSQSWIVAVQVLTKPFWCPGECIFCPNDPEMPKSYIKSEPGAMRAWLNQFDPKKQVYNRLLSLSLTGHPIDKIELIVLWGTRDVYPNDYKIEFIKWLYDACNNFHKLDFVMKSDEQLTQDNTESQEESKNKVSQRFWYTIKNIDQIDYPETIQESITINETADNRIIWLTVETRPEYVNDKNCKEWRELWVTRLEMWVQSTDNDVLQANKRWHNVQCIRDAIHKLRQYWFKFSIHIMPWLYKSDYQKDLLTMQTIYSDEYIKPDEIKFYPTSVIPNTELFDLYKKWEYSPITKESITNLVHESLLHIVPPYSRIKRLIRDIPSTEIEAGSNITNLSQLIHNDMKKELQQNQTTSKIFYQRLYWEYNLFWNIEDFINTLHISPKSSENKTYIIWSKPDLETYRNFISLDTRSREIRNKSIKKQDSQNPNLVIRKYSSSVWTEFFISYEDQQGYLYWFTRLLLPHNENIVDYKWLWENIAIIRELHVYWQLASLNKQADNNWKKQHQGFGTKLMNISEQISEKFWYNWLSVISWVWVREYYRKLGYVLEWNYMKKKL